jgi:hypothetical protein
MNSALISPGISAIFSALLSDYSPESTGGRPSAEASGLDFGELLNNQQDVGKLMQRLEKLLPPEDFERLKLAIADGKSLPQAVTIAAGQLPEDGHWEPESSAPVPADGTTKVSPLTAPEDPEQAIHRQPTAVPQPVIKLPSSTAVGSSDPRQAGTPGKTVSPATTVTGSAGLLQATASAVVRQPTVSGADNGPVAPASPGNASSAATGHFVPNIRVPVSGTVQQPLTGEQLVSTPSAGIHSAVSGVTRHASATDLSSPFQSTTIQPNSAAHPEGITAGLDHVLLQTQIPGPDGGRVVAPSSPDLVSRTAIPETATNSHISTGEKPYQPGRAEAASSVTVTARFVQPLSMSDQNRAQSLPASSDRPAQTMVGEGDNAARIAVAENLPRPDRAGSAAPSQPAPGLSVPANSTT